MISAASALLLLYSLASKTSFVSSAQTQCPQFRVQKFAQNLDHNTSNSNITFQQSYQLDTTRFKPGGPILFYQGAENSQINCVEFNHINDMAEELGAIVAGLEHRFFGDSFPDGVDAENPSAEGLAPLTLENVLKDSVNFVEWIKDTVSGSKESKVVITGGSYGGFLTTAARTQHPDTFYAAWASGPVVSAFGSQQDSEERFKHWDYVAKVYQEQSAKASDKISKAMFEFKACASKEEGSCDSLLDDMHLCDPQPANVTEMLQLYAAVAQSYLYAAQFNARIPISFPMAYPLIEITDQTLSAATFGDVLRIPAMLYNWQVNQSECLDWKSANLTGGAFTGVSLPSYEWISCHYLIFAADSIREGSMFPPQEVPPGCAKPEWEGPKFNYTGEQWINELGFSRETLMDLGRILFTQGGYDPTTALGPPDFGVPAFANSTRTLLIPGLGHTEEVFSDLVEPVGLSPELDLAQDIITQIIKGWLAESPR